MWTIQLLGGLAARRSQQEVTRFRTQKSAALLAYLAFHAAPPSLPQPRDVLPLSATAWMRMPRAKAFR